MRVGNYIHFNYSDYTKHGLRMKDGGRPAKPSSIVQQHKEQLKKLGQDLYISPPDIAKLERQLNFFYGDSDTTRNGGGQLTEADRKLLQEALFQYLSQHIKEIQEYDISMDDLSAYRNTESVSSSNRKLLSIDKTWAAAIVHRIAEIKDKIAHGSSALKNNLTQEFQKFEKEYSKIIQDVQSISSTLTQSDKDAGYSVPLNRRVQINQKYFDAHKYLTSEDTPVQFASFIESINEMLSMIKVSLVSQILGHMGEYVAAIMPQIYRNMATQEVSKIIQDFTSNIDKYIVGGQVSAKVIDEKSVFGVKAGQHLSKAGNTVQDVQFGKFGVRSNINYTQDKIDVILNISDNQTVTASVKNIHADSREIHLLSGSSLLKYLQLYPAFANHYLNVTANIRINEESGKKGVPASPSAVAVMHKGMLATLGTHALIGGLKGINKMSNNIYNTGKAQVFVVNTHGGGKGGKFHVIPMQRLLNNIEDNIIVSGGINHDTPKEWHNKFLAQLPGKTAGQAAAARIINILTEVHSVKLSVSIRSDAVFNMKT